MIKFEGIENILDKRIIKETNSKISQFQLEEIKPNEFKLNWKHFDPDYGIKFQLIYVGLPNIGAEVNSVVYNTNIIQYNQFWDSHKFKEDVLISICVIIATILLLLLITKKIEPIKSFIKRLKNTTELTFDLIGLKAILENKIVITIFKLFLYLVILLHLTNTMVRIYMIYDIKESVPF